MPTFERPARFDRDLETLTPQQRAAFLAAVKKFVDDLVAGQGFRKGLRVKGFGGALARVTPSEGAGHGCTGMSGTTYSSE